MAVRGVGVTDTASGAGVADVRTRERTVDGGTFAEQYVVPIDERVASYKGMYSTFRSPGRAATTQVLFTIANKTGSGVLLALRRLSIQQETSAVVNISWANQFKTARVAGTVPANGTVMTKVPFDSNQSSAANVEARGDASADGTTSASALTAAFTTVAWHQFAMRMHTAVGQVLLDDESLIPSLADADPVILRENEAMIVSVLANATAANGATVFYLINCMWEEFTLP